MRPIDPRILEILKTEVGFERALRTCPAARERFAEEALRGSGQPDPYAPLKDRVSVGRMIRYVEWPPHRNYLIEISCVLSGECHVHIAGKEIVLRRGDIFIPNQYTVFSRDPLGENDILVSFILKPQYLQEVSLQLKAGSPLADFMLDTLRQEASWNRYLHFTDVDDIAVTDLIETMVYAAFPYLDDQNITCGCAPEPQFTAYLLTGLFMSLSRNLESLSEDSAADYDEIVIHAVRTYIGNEYKSASLKELAARLKQSESSLSRQIKGLFGFTFKELLLQRRFESAVKLLEQTDLSVSAVAEAVGYENTSFFYRRFRAMYGISPKDYRRKR